MGKVVVLRRTPLEHTLEELPDNNKPCAGRKDVPVDSLSKRYLNVG